MSVLTIPLAADAAERASGVVSEPDPLFNAIFIECPPIASFVERNHDQRVID
jgi:hypothetical protein